MKSLKDKFCQAVKMFICFVINLLSGGNKKREEVLLTASSCGNSGNPSANNETDVENFSVNELSANESLNENSVENKMVNIGAKNSAWEFPSQKTLCRIRVPCVGGYGGSPPEKYRFAYQLKKRHIIGKKAGFVYETSNLFFILESCGSSFNPLFCRNRISGKGNCSDKPYSEGRRLPSFYFSRRNRSR